MMLTQHRSSSATTTATQVSMISASPIPLDYTTWARQENSPLLSSLLLETLDQVVGVDDAPIEDLSSIFDAETMTSNNNHHHHRKRSKPSWTSNIDNDTATAITTNNNSGLHLKRQKQAIATEVDCDEAAVRFRPYQEKQWVEQFEELVKFKNAHGHCLVPHTFEENPVLARWVKRQRYQYKLKQEAKASTMTDARIQQLEDFGFIWDSHAVAWQERRNELSIYQQEHGNCNVPSNYPKNPKLATWVKSQRRQSKLFWNEKPTNMTLDRITSLSQLGFTWELRGSRSSNNSPDDTAVAAAAAEATGSSVGI